MPRLVDIYEKSQGASVFKDPDGFSPQGVGNSTPRSYGVGQYQGIEDGFGDGSEAYKDRGGFEDNSGFGLGFREPYVWTSPADSDFKKKIKKYDSRAFPIGSAVQDAVRIGKFTLSGKGVLWLLKQQLLHQQAPHDETNIVDPTSHLASTIRPASLGTIPRVAKHVSDGSLVGGIVSLLGGSALGEPKSTVDPGTLPSGLNITQKESNFGLLRGNTAKKARGKMIPESVESTGLLGRFISSIFGNSFSAEQPDGVGADKMTGFVYRADQDRYDLLIANPYNLETLTYPENIRSPLFKFHNSSALNSISPDFKFNIYSPESVAKSSMNYQGSESIRFGAGGVGLFDNKSYRKFLDTLEEDDNSFILKFRRKWREPAVLTSTKGNLGIKHTDHYNQLNRFWINSRFSGIQSNDFYGVSSVIEPARSLNNDETGIPSQRDSNESQRDSNDKPPYERKIVGTGEENSRMSKFFNSMVDGNLQNTTQQLKGSKNIHVLNRIPVHSENEIFMEKLSQTLTDKFGDGKLLDPDTNYPINPTKPEFYGLKEISSIEEKYNIGFRKSKITGKDVTDYTRYNMGIHGVKANDVNDDIRRDTLNLQNVLDYKDDINSNEDLKDLIRFSFHDIVNNKIAFFRSTLKSISDQVTPEWSDIRYLGRADKVYVYNGLTRTISFNFRVYASSRKEMWPMWQRINYLYGMTYPSNIVKYDGFGINLPPYIKMTIGNLYKNQPVLINSIAMTVPDEASWEIDEGQQYPMMVELSLTTTFLEQEAPKINNAHFDIPTNDKIRVDIQDIIRDSSETLADHNKSNTIEDKPYQRTETGGTQEPLAQPYFNPNG